MDFFHPLCLKISRIFILCSYVAVSPMAFSITLREAWDEITEARRSHDLVEKLNNINSLIIKEKRNLQRIKALERDVHFRVIDQDNKPKNVSTLQGEYQEIRNEVLIMILMIMKIETQLETIAREKDKALENSRSIESSLKRAEGILKSHEASDFAPDAELPILFHREIIHALTRENEEWEKAILILTDIENSLEDVRKIGIDFLEKYEDTIKKFVNYQNNLRKIKKLIFPIKNGQIS